MQERTQEGVSGAPEQVQARRTAVLARMSLEELLYFILAGDGRRLNHEAG